MARMRNNTQKNMSDRIHKEERYIEHQERQLRGAENEMAKRTEEVQTRRNQEPGGRGPSQSSRQPPYDRMRNTRKSDFLLFSSRRTRPALQSEFARRHFEESETAITLRFVLLTTIQGMPGVVFSKFKGSLES